MKSRETQETFVERFRSALELRKLSQNELATILGVQTPAINHFACGRRSPSLASLAKLADALDVSADYLLGRTDTPTVGGPVADEITRLATKLSSHDLQTVIALARNLANRK